VIVQAATELFLDRGYHATSIGQVAAASGVAVQMIYNSVGSKRELLSRVLDYAAAGERAPMLVPEFMRDSAEREPDPHRVVEQLVQFWRGALPRTAPIFRIIHEAAATVFAIGHPDTYRTLVLEGEWHERRWATWARTTLTAALLRD
jgi:AcrR family transcriptional regulator